MLSMYSEHGQMAQEPYEELRIMTFALTCVETGCDKAVAS